MQSQFQAQQGGTWPDGTIIVGVPGIRFLVVGGGAGGGGGGGGGAGGYRAAGFGPSPLQFPGGISLNKSPTGFTTNITVGAGGGPDAKGNDSILNPGGVEGVDMITGSAGGAGGGAPNKSPGSITNRDGGSGGGESNVHANRVGAGNTPPVSPPQGNSGGTASSPNGSGGGGGATASGSNGPGGSGGSGGAGAPNLINCGGTPFSVTTFAGGGGGTGPSSGAGGGPGGGGGGAPGGGTDGTVNTGGGGGGGWSAAAGDGGSGVVVVRGPSALTFAVTPGTNATATHPGGDKIATFTVSGTLTIS